MKQFKSFCPTYACTIPKAEKRKREQSEDQESEVDKEDDASIKGDSADGVEERRKKKKKKKKQSIDGI